MTAAVLGGAGQRLQIDEVQLAPPQEGEVLVKVAASGLCASDLNAIDGKRTLAPFRPGGRS
jgi:S-(hydroxymethyl)glutathione dehydrogenase/alcohol dehydrogenase